jgi:acid phosphatase
VRDQPSTLPARTAKTRRRRLWQAVAATLLLAAGCAAPVTQHDVSIAAPPNLGEAKRQIATYIDSGRYAADLAGVGDQARAYLESRAARGGKLAIVVDIDETALSNLPSLRANDFGFILGGPCELPRGPCGLLAWIAMGKAEPIKPVLALVRAARERGVAVFFLTGRTERLRAATEANLRAVGYEWTAVLLRPDDLTTQSAADFKAPERKKIMDQGYTIIVNIGDQMSDLDGGFAERTYKLPNPFYFIP